MESSWRTVRIFVYAVILAALILYGYFCHPGVTLDECLAAPEKYDGAVIEVGREAVVEKVFENGFSIRQLGKSVRVYASTENVSPGEFILLLARFHKPCTLEAIHVRVAKRRRAKIWLSAFPALFVLFYFFRRYRFDFHSFYFEER